MTDPIQAHLQASAAIGQLRLQIASQNLAHLLAAEYAQRLAEAREKVRAEMSMYGDGADKPEPVLNFNINLDNPIKLSIVAAEGLLKALGVVR